MRIFASILALFMLWLAPPPIQAQTPTPPQPTPTPFPFQLPFRTPTAHILPGFGEFAPSMPELSSWGFSSTRSFEVSCAPPLPFKADYANARVEPACAAPFAAANKPQAVIVHATGIDFRSALLHYRSGMQSMHYVIDRDGSVYQLVPESLPAKHVSCALEGCLASCPAAVCAEGYPELRSIGIALVNYGQVPQEWSWGSVYEDYLMSWNWRWWDDYTDAQITALKALTLDIAARHKFPPDAEHVVPAYRIRLGSEPGPALNLFWQRVGNPPREAVFR